MRAASLHQLGACLRRHRRRGSAVQRAMIFDGVGEWRRIGVRTPVMELVLHPLASPDRTPLVGPHQSRSWFGHTGSAALTRRANLFFYCGTPVTAFVRPTNIVAAAGGVSILS